MFFFTIAFGDRHVDSFFRNAFFSIMRQKGLEEVKARYGLHFLIATTDESQSRVQERIAEVSADFPDCRFDIVSVDAGGNISAPDRHLLVATLLRLCMIHCLNEDRKFFYVAPDTVYSPEVLRYGLMQHELTGRVVAIFNGRIRIGFGETEKVRAYLGRDRGILAAYLENWDETMNLMVPEGNSPRGIKILEHAIVLQEDFVSIYTSNPNPTLGKFEMQDLVLFEHSHSLHDWDHYWKERLFDQNRLYIQTNLDLGMSVELDDEAALASEANHFAKAGDRIAYVDLVRRASEHLLRKPRTDADLGRMELGARLNNVSFSARLP